jgi:hypothetical protein
VQTNPTDAQPASQLWSTPPAYHPSPAVVLVNSVVLDTVMVVLMAVVLGAWWQ